jgi:hypothetical protein
MFIADVRVYSRSTVRKLKHHHKLVRLLVNAYCKHALRPEMLGSQKCLSQ